MSTKKKKAVEVPYRPWDVTQPTGYPINESQRKAKIYDAFRRMAKAPSMDAAGLIQLLLSANGGKIKAFSDEEIDSAIHLVARCQWRLELAKEGWDARAAKLLRETDPEPEPSEKVKKIRSLKGSIIKFNRGLIALGVPTTGSKTEGENRKTNFFLFFKVWFIGNHRCNFLYGTDGDSITEGVIRIGSARDLKDWVEPSESEIRSAYKKQQKTGWTASDLEIILSSYDKWLSEKKQKQRSDAGKKSVIVQANPKKKQSKGKP
jgi:hypothetical protein